MSETTGRLSHTLNDWKQRMTPKSPRGKRWSAGLGILAVAGLASLSIFATGPDATPDVPTEKAWPVSATVISPITVRPTFSAFGRVESRAIARIRTDVIARVTEVPVREGQWVEAGDLLARLDDRELALILAEREADLAREQAALRSRETEYALLQETTEHYRSMYEVATAKLDRHEELRGRKLISRSLFDEALSRTNEATIDFETHRRALADMPNRIAEQRAVVRKAQVLTEKAELDVQKTEIRAPFSGPVTEVFAAPGDHSSLGAPIIAIADASGFELRVQIPDHRTAAQLDAGHVVATTEDDHRLTLVRIARQVRSGQTGQDAFFGFATTGAADNLQRLPEIGRLLNVDITLPPELDVVALPVQSIFDSSRIYAIEAHDAEHRLRAVDVERVGQHKDADGQLRVLVRSPDLEGGMRVITTQLPKAITGLLVVPIG